MSSAKRDSGRSRTQSGSSAISAFFSSSSLNNNNQSQPNNNQSQSKDTSNINRNSNSAINQASFRKSADKPFHSLYERTLDLISKLYSIADFEYYLFPQGVNALLNDSNAPVIDPIAILWRCFRLGAPLCHLLNQARPRQALVVPNVSGFTDYSSRSKDCVFRFLKGVSEELNVPVEALFTISELGKDDTNGLVKVMDVVEMVLEEIQRRNLGVPQKQLPFALGQLVQSEAKDNRSKSIAELLATERSYVQSLQELLFFRQELTNKGTVSNDMIHSIFSNLSELLDFQRRFLFSLEATLAMPYEDQNIGSIFIQYQEGFQVYTPMCASYSKAIAVALENQDVLSGGSINPGRDLQGYLIKPVQRICRYPLLLKEIVKLTDPKTFKYYEELRDAELVMKRVADKVNEVQRMEENRKIKEELIEKIDDLQGLNPQEWGDLLLYDKFPMSTKDSEQMYHIYLFEMLLLCCKESSRDSKKKRSSKSVNNAGSFYDIKGKIYAKSISDVVNAKDGRFEVKVYWNEMEESFMLKCRNVEQADLWANRISLCASGKTSEFRPSSDKSGLVHRSNAYRRVQSYYDNTDSDQNGYSPSVVESNDRSSKVTSLPISARSSSNRSSDGSNLAIQGNIGLRRDTSRDTPFFPKRSSSNLGGFNTNLVKSSSLPNPIAEKAPSSTLPQPHTSFLPEPPGASTHQRGTTNGASSNPLSIPTPRPNSIPPPAPPPKSSLPIPPSGPPKIPLPLAPNSVPPESLTSQLSETHITPPSSKLPLPPTVPPKEERKRAHTVNALPPSIVAASGLIKMKTHYGSDIFVLAVSANGSKFDEILDRIERKIRICGATMPEGRRVKLRYRDEEGDFISINGDDDIEMAFEMARRTSQNGTITIQAE